MEEKQVKGNLCSSRCQVIELTVGFEEEASGPLSQEIIHCTHEVDIIGYLYSWLHREEISNKGLAKSHKDA